MAQRLQIDRVLRCQSTNRYLKESGWTEQETEAWVFPTEFDAVQACREKGLRQVELVLRVRGQKTDIFAMPVEP